MWLLCWVLALMGCRSPATEIELVLDTDVPRSRVIELRIASFAGLVDPSRLSGIARERMLREVVLTSEVGVGLLPGSVGIVPNMGNANEPVTVWIRARVSATVNAPEVLLDRVVGVRFVRGVRGVARVFLPLWRR